MFDLEQSLREWRREIEATLAFSDDEIDELEDHLRFSFDASLKDGLTQEISWARSVGDLGSASSLALEFAKDKLMPALLRLVVAWWRPAILMFPLGLTFYFSMPNSGRWILNGTPSPGLWAPVEELFGVAALSLWATLTFLPHKAQKNAVLAGIGNAICLIPLLHVIFYNPLIEKFVGVGWSWMAASFGWLPLSLSVIGIFLLNAWWWKKSRTLAGKFPTMVAIIATLVLLLTLSPFCSELIGRLSIRDLYNLPTADQITVSGAARDQFLKFKFIDVLINSMAYLESVLPLALATIVGVGIFALQHSVRAWKMKEPQDAHIFPSTRELPLIMTMLSSGVCWVISSLLEPALNEQFRAVKRSIGQPATGNGGFEIVVLCSAALFFIAGYQLTKRLRQSVRIRPFYAGMIAVTELAVFVGITIAFLLPGLIPGHSQSDPHDVSAQPGWVSWILALAVLRVVLSQARIIWSRVHQGTCETSLWQFDGKGLVQFGLLLGLSMACSGMILTKVALDMAYVSVTFISALIAWGDSITKPATAHFNPQDYGISDHLSFFAVGGLGYVSLCLAWGLGIAMILSALEFIRFNSFRLYKVRKARRGLTETLATSE